MAHSTNLTNGTAAPGQKPVAPPPGSPGRSAAPAGAGSGASSMAAAVTPDLGASQFENLGTPAIPEEPPTARILNAGALQAALKPREEKQLTPSPAAAQGTPPLLPNSSPSASFLVPPPASPPASLLPSSTPQLQSGKITSFEPSREKEISVASIVWRKVSRILQRVAVRSPHIFIGITAVYLPFKYYMNNENFACDAATFVGVAGTVYCFVRATILEVIPEWMLPQEPKYNFWRHAINITNTVFITLTLTSAVWKLNISAVQGTACWAIPHALSYYLLSDRYPDIDNNKWANDELGTKS